jgi:hypothetical protein
MVPVFTQISVDFFFQDFPLALGTRKLNLKRNDFLFRGKPCPCHLEILQDKAAQNELTLLVFSRLLLDVSHPPVYP